MSAGDETGPQDTWARRARWFDRYGPPLRPTEPDLAIYRGFVEAHFGPTERSRPALLLGVTPEFVTMEWPVPLEWTAVDQSPAMLTHVWPGDIAGRRRAVVGDWFTMGPPAMQRPDLVVTDGAPVFFARPESLFERVRDLLSDEGLFVVRAFCAPSRRDRIDTVLADARAGRIDNFHRFKWRVAMALQEDPRRGVAQSVVKACIEAAHLDYARLPQPGFDARAVSTLSFYDGGDATLHFPSRADLTTSLLTRFAHVESAHPGYVDGERYVVFRASGRGV